MKKTIRFDHQQQEEVENNNHPVQQPESEILGDYLLSDLVINVQLLTDRVRRLERSAAVNRRKSIAVAGDDAETVNDGSCSARCMKYFVDLVAITGMKEIHRAKHPLVKSMWTVTLILSIGITIYYVVSSAKKYYEEPTATKVKIHRENNYSYPALILCPDTWLDYQKALTLGATRGAVQYALAYLIDYKFRAPPYKITNYAQAKSDFEKWYYEIGNYSSLVELFKDIAIDSEAFVYKCPNCASRNFTKVLMDETICYHIPMENMTGKGTSRGATEILEVIVPDLSDGLLHRKKYWRLYVNPDLTIGVSTVRFFQIFPGYSNTIRFTPTHYLSIATTEDPCRPNSISKNADDETDEYSTIECALRCAHRGRRCKNVGSIRQTSVMRNLTDICHYYPQFYWFLYNAIKPDHKLIDPIPDKCFEECPPTCDRWLYDAAVESHKISSYVPSNASGTSTPVPMTRLYILNEAPLQGGYLLFKEMSTYEFPSAIGDIGGIMALWLGASVMSIIQMFVFLITWFFARYLNWRGNKETRFENDMMTSNYLTSSSIISNGDTVL